MITFDPVTVNLPVEFETPVFDIKVDFFPIREAGTVPYIGENGNWWVGTTDTGIEAKGDTGETGNGIATVELISTEGLVKTYTITFTDSTTTTFNVEDGADGHSPVITFIGTTIYVNGVAGADLKGATGAAGTNGTNGSDGVGISDIQFIETIGLVDYYEITLSDSSKYQFTVTNGEKGDDGKGITSITLTNTVGKTKTYTITFTDNSTITFSVVDGNDGNDGDDGHSPVITFVGTTIYIDGVAGADLKGEPGNDATVDFSTDIEADKASTTKVSAIKTFYDWVVGLFQKKTLYFSNKTVLTTDFVVDTTYADYGYKAVISCTGVTSTMLSEVTFAPIEADSGNYAAVCLSGTGTVTIYAKSVPSGTITIPTIKAETV